MPLQTSTGLRRVTRRPLQFVGFSHRLPGLLFVSVPERKAVKNRLHLDFRPDDQLAEVDRLLGLGATLADVGQGAQPWVVLQDPEGNEFCVLSAKRHPA